MCWLFGEEEGKKIKGKSGSSLAVSCLVSSIHLLAFQQVFVSIFFCGVVIRNSKKSVCSELGFWRKEHCYHPSLGVCCFYALC